METEDLFKSLQTKFNFKVPEEESNDLSEAMKKNPTYEIVDEQKGLYIQFNKDKDVMTLYPALTETSAFEMWYHIE